MPRYFFQTSDRGSRPDRVGVELAGPREARNEALRAAGEIVQDLDDPFWDDSEWRMEVTDDEGRTVCTLTITGETGKL